ncbi:hypothetical protein P171DRAFT_430897 [Karstenula rhodostoma CBS 690.94]|uniref:Uncharacterized protein n=1 Tax=Karstenula rhodostoma CBS 690.94 TaxID=1392251 RepID=A0A9P4PLT2_9PLEO|nr:hypothetical protein P171DRAFT_430897 [Karstenula rhodostoma CBS 690.94]
MFKSTAWTRSRINSESALLHCSLRRLIKMSNASQPQSFDDQIYTGFWINRAKVSTYGAPLTLDCQAGNFLIAFLALYVSIAGQSFWTISRFLLHKYLSSESQSDGVYHQHQAILRNSITAPQVAEERFKLMIAWRNRTQKLFFVSYLYRYLHL